MMKKVAIFVEGQTELHFVNRLITEIAGYGKVRIHLFIHRGGAMRPIRTEGAPEDAAEVTLMIVNCEGDAKVKSSIIEHKPRLVAQGYSALLGLQDLYPKKLEELERFRTGLSKDLNFSDVHVQIFLAVKEVESWFLNEFNHFEKLNPLLTPDYIKTHTGFDPRYDDAETTINHPAGTLSKIYELIGEKYKKREAQTHRLVSKLDYSYMYVSMRGTSQSFGKFIDGIETQIFS